MDFTKNHKTTYFSIHSLCAMNNGSFSIVTANCPNKPCARILASVLFPESDFYIQFHDYKVDLKPVITPY